MSVLSRRRDLIVGVGALRWRWGSAQGVKATDARTQEERVRRIRSTYYRRGARVESTTCHRGIGRESVPCSLFAQASACACTGPGSRVPLTAASGSRVPPRHRGIHREKRPVRALRTSVRPSASMPGLSTGSRRGNRTLTFTLYPFFACPVRPWDFAPPDSLGRTDSQGRMDRRTG